MFDSRKSPKRENHRYRGRRGFTLIEMLVVIAIIAILTSIFLGALSSSERLAKASRTRALIQKLHNVMMSRWDAYRTIRLPISLESNGASASAGYAGSESTRFRQDMARRKMLALRELVRMEMPDRYDDILFDSANFPVVLKSPSGAAIRPFLWSAYNRKILSVKAGSTDPTVSGMSSSQFIKMLAERYQSAECLYMIVTLGVEDSSTSTEHFSAKDIGDADSDGMFEFVDAWGIPIEFLRWAPGFISPMQPMYSYPIPGAGSFFDASSQPRDPSNPNAVLSHWKVQNEYFNDTNAPAGALSQRWVVIDQDDPFNPMRVGPTPDTVVNKALVKSTRWQPGYSAPEHGFILIPLIYSCGGDFKSGIDHCYASEGYTLKTSPTASLGPIKDSDPYNIYKSATADGSFRGTKVGGERLVVGEGYYPGDGNSLDNIHNQDIGSR
ncbi:MAG: type II secretion system GspH family protein [Planctomycetia bacterium]|nr:type II secretion system GspH family protein [Planctomycetia bacterium]